MPGIGDTFRRLFGRGKANRGDPPDPAGPEPELMSGGEAVDSSAADSPPWADSGRREADAAEPWSQSFAPPAEPADAATMASHGSGSLFGGQDTVSEPVDVGTAASHGSEALFGGQGDGAAPADAGNTASGSGGGAGTATMEPPASSALPGVAEAETAAAGDDDVLYADHLLLICPYCGLPEQRVGSRCEKCNQVIVRLPPWAQRRRQNWFMRRLSWRRVVTACVIVLFIVFVIWVNYPFAPNPVVLFKNVHSQMTIDDGPGSWSAVGRDLRNSRNVTIGSPPPAGRVKPDVARVLEPLNGEPVSEFNNVYVGSANGVYALAHHDLTLREGWEGDTPGRVTGAAAVVGSYLFFGSTDHTVNAWNALTGAPLWSFAAADTVEVSPVVADGLVYIGSGEGWVYALDAQDGSLIWRRQLDSNASAAVAVYEGRLFVGDEQGTFYILSARTGQEWFRYRTRRAISGAPVVSADGARVYFASGGQLYAVDAQRREIPGLYQFAQVWAQLWLWQVPGVPRPQGQQGGLWQFTPDNPLQGVKSSPALAEDESGSILYMGGHDHILYALDASKERLDDRYLWHFEAEEAIWASPLVVKDQVIFGDDAGNLYSLDRKTGAQTWHLTLSAGIRIAPVISNGLLIVRTGDGRIYGIE